MNLPYSCSCTGKRSVDISDTARPRPALVILLAISIAAACLLAPPGYTSEKIPAMPVEPAAVFEPWQLEGLSLALKDPDPKVRIEAIKELARSKKRSDIPSLPQLLKD